MDNRLKKSIEEKRAKLGKDCLCLSSRKTDRADAMSAVWQPSCEGPTRHGGRGPMNEALVPTYVHARPSTSPDLTKQQTPSSQPSVGKTNKADLDLIVSDLLTPSASGPPSSHGPSSSGVASPGAVPKPGDRAGKAGAGQRVASGETSASSREVEAVPPAVDREAAAFGSFASLARFDARPDNVLQVAARRAANLHRLFATSIRAQTKGKTPRAPSRLR